MAKQQSADALVRQLASLYRVVTLGGVAVISHGFPVSIYQLTAYSARPMIMSQTAVSQIMWMHSTRL